MLADLNRRLFKRKTISENLVLKFYETQDKQQTIIEVDYMNGKFVIDRTCKNNLAGQDKLKAIIEEFDTEEKAKAYFEGAVNAFVNSPIKYSQKKEVK